MGFLRVTPGVSPKYLTLVIVRAGETLLLGRKKRGFGAGYYNGFGGKVEHGESIRAAAVRELQEEAGLTTSSAAWRGLLVFRFDDQPVPWHVHVFEVLAGQCQGTPTPSDEMDPVWIGQHEIPYNKMWADDRYWYPLLLAGKSFYGVFDFKDTHTLVGHTLEEVPASSQHAACIDDTLIVEAP